MTSITITTAAYQALKNTVGRLAPECGAVIGAGEQHPSVISCVWFDRRAGSGQAFYTPSCADIEQVVQTWEEHQHRFAGIVHSHADDFPTLSPMDVRSGQLIMSANHMPSILLGLFHKEELTMFRVSAAPEGERPIIEELEITIT